MRVRANYTRYEPGFGFRPVGGSGVICAVCGYDVEREEEVDFWNGLACHARCLEERREKLGER